MTKISAIIFDLGGVILNIDQEKTLRAFRRLGLELEDVHSEMPIFNEFETGRLSVEEFRLILKTKLHGQISDEQIDTAWNAMILDLPIERLNIIKKLRRHFKVYLLSNTNALHMKEFYQMLEQTHGIDTWHNLFDQIFYSYQIGMRKPEYTCYEYVCQQINLAPEQCIFIDDSKVNIKGAEVAGLKTFWSPRPISMSNLTELLAVIKTEFPEFN
jgi:glucose-1-phosphatase